MFPLCPFTGARLRWLSGVLHPTFRWWNHLRARRWYARFISSSGIWHHSCDTLVVRVERCEGNPLEHLCVNGLLEEVILSLHLLLECLLVCLEDCSKRSTTSRVLL